MISYVYIAAFCALAALLLWLINYETVLPIRRKIAFDGIVLFGILVWLLAGFGYLGESRTIVF